MNDKKNIVVTGGAGFLGSHVVKNLLDNNYKVVVLDDFSNGKMAHLDTVKENENLTIIFGDIAIKEDVKKALSGADAVIHLAVLDLRQSLKDPHRVNEVIVNGTLHLLDTALENNIELFLNCSSSEAYGTADYVPMDERHPLRPETPYAAAKVAQDMYVHSYGRSFGLTWSTIRPFNMYGPNSHWQGFRGELIPKMIVRAMNKKPLVIFGEGDQTRDFIYVEDAAKAVLKVLENEECRFNTINFSSGRETQIKRIAELICENFNLDKNEFIEKQPPRPGDVKRHLGDNTKFKTLLGFEPQVKIEEGIKRTIDWFKSLPYSPEELLNQEVVRNWE